MKAVVTLILLLCGFQARAFVTELGVNYGQKKSSFDANNYTSVESMTGSVSFYFTQKLAVELSYTSAISVQQEKTTSGGTVISQSTIVQTTQAYGADLIWVFADDHSALFQPYVKGGVAQLHREQQVKVNDLETYTLKPEDTLVPSYGVGFKIALTETFGIKASYDAWRTPIGGGASTTDDALHVGVTWMF